MCSCHGQNQDLNWNCNLPDPWDLVPGSPYLPGTGAKWCQLVEEHERGKRVSMSLQNPLSHVSSQRLDSARLDSCVGGATSVKTEGQTHSDGFGNITVSYCAGETWCIY